MSVPASSKPSNSTGLPKPGVPRGVVPRARSRAYAVLVRSRFNRDLVALIAGLVELRPLLLAVAKHTPKSFTKELCRAGVNLDDEESADFAEGFLLALDCVPADAEGFLWVFDHFLGIAEVHASGKPDDEATAIRNTKPR